MHLSVDDSVRTVHLDMCFVSMLHNLCDNLAWQATGGGETDTDF